MSGEKYPLLETERSEEDMFFTSDVQDQACIGHLRGDFGRGTEFWTSWWDRHEDLKDQDFKCELDDVVNALRKDGPLKDLPSMQRFCREHSQAQMSPRSGSEYYGLRVDTAQHRYYLRFCPMRGNYNFYIYCYKAALLAKPIKVLVAEPMKPCEVREIPNTLDAMRQIVGGGIEAVTSIRYASAIVCNENGKLLGLPHNRPLLDESGLLPLDMLHGTFFITGISGEHFVSLTDEQIDKYKSLYDNVAVLTAEKPAPQEKTSAQKKKAAKGRAER